MEFLKISRRSILLLLVVILALPFSTAFANGAKPSATAVQARDIDTSVVDTNYPNPGSFQTFGTSAPTSFWNLVNDYNGSAVFKYRVYTNYYFAPSADNDIYVQFSADWDYGEDNSMVRVECYEKDTHTKVTSHETFGAPPISNTVRFYNLNPNKFYYFVIVKTNDEEDADLFFSVYH